MPDVTVVVAVYNAMPYLRRCLDSLVGQTIGARRMEIVAVDDGSTDGGGRLLDRYARRHPNMTVLRQPNSGGPARPNNRALDAATGRYVFFVGADDRLGPEALERLVAEADRVGADVVAGRMVGVNGRWVPTEIFARSDDDVDLYNSALPYAMSNTKLFRRCLLDEHGIRYREDLPFGSDQPFTLAACVRAKRISVLADYDYYYAVTRRRRDNITFSTGHERKLACTAQIMDATAALVDPGPHRDAVIARSFHTELWKLMQADFIRLDAATRERVCAGIARLCDLYLTPGVAARLGVERRVRFALARGGHVEELVAAIRRHATTARPPLVQSGDRWYAAYPTFREPALGLPDEVFEVTADPAEAAAHQLTAESAAWRHGRLVMQVAGADGGRFDLEFGRRELFTGAHPHGEHRPVSIEYGSDHRRMPLAARPGLPRRARMAWRRGRVYRIAPGRDAAGDLVLMFTQVTVARVVAKLRSGRGWTAGRRTGFRS